MALSLKNKLVFFLVSTIWLLLLNCSGDSPAKEEATSSAPCDTTLPLNPNGYSELSLLMRHMQNNAQELKQKIEKGEMSGDFPAEFLKIHTAKPTDLDTKKASFNAFADNYILNLRALYTSDKEHLKQNYNAVINACLSCHGEHCPGPVKAIKKLQLGNK